ncbi:MAG TPA: hypothetical protein VGG30_06945 [Pirellulales bacterium]|jgi:hypothetical protein
MPTPTRFSHQQYRSAAPISPHHLLAPRAPGIDPGDQAQHAESWRQIAAAYHAVGLSTIYLIRGSVGLAAANTLDALARTFPPARGALRRAQREMADSPPGDSGTFTRAYAHEFERSLGTDGGSRIAVRLVEWSDENNHLGRADAAVRLVALLAGDRTTERRRMLIWAHGHAGNVVALATHLLSGNRSEIDTFFAAAEVYYRWPVLGWIDIPLWRRVRALLEERAGAADRMPLDLVTFGTPVLYGWNQAGYNRLLHFVFHRPVAGLPSYRAPFPLEAEKIFRAADGDYVQQLGIAGTDVPPGIFAWRARWADRRLGRMLQASLPDTSTAERLRPGVRVAESGTTLLVDYGASRGRLADHCGGHAVYAQRQWLLFHAQEIARRFYPPARVQAA